MSAYASYSSPGFNSSPPPAYGLPSAEGTLAQYSAISQSVASSDRGPETTAFAGLLWKPDSGMSTPNATLFAWEADKLVKIDAVGLPTSALQRLPLSNSFSSTTDVAGILHLATDGSVEIKASSATLLGSSIQFPASSISALGIGGTSLGDPNSSSFVTLFVDRDGGVKLGGIPLKMADNNILAADTSLSSSLPNGGLATDSFPWLHPTPLKWPSQMDSNIGIG